MTKEYLNLHAHSTSSLLDGMAKFNEYSERAKNLGMRGVCFTEHGNLHGLLDAYVAAEQSDLKYFPGIEFYQARKTRFDRDPEEQSGKESEEWAQRGPYHLGAIAYNKEGYHNLIKLSSRAFTEGFYVKPRVDHQLLSEHVGGFVLLSGCLSGEVQQALLRDDYGAALNNAARMRDIVGVENYFIEVQNHGLEEEKRNYPYLIKIANELGLKIVATCDSHYTLKEHHDAHDIHLCINTGSTIDNPNRFKFCGPHFYLKSYEEMASMFPEEYLKNTLLIYDRHDFKLSFNEYHIPQFAVHGDDTAESVFSAWVKSGAEERFGKNWAQNREIVERLNYEVGVIKEMEFPNYFLIVADIVRYARQNGIMVGPGRGSAAGSLVAFCMRITEVNPLEYNLPFERFLIPGRKSLPDIDLDFDERYREQVINYTREKYGIDHTTQIGTISEIGAKTAVKDVARVLNYPYAVGDKISKAMPPPLFGRAKSLKECLESAEFLQLYQTDEDVKKIIDYAKVFEGQWRQAGMHPAGLVIADKPVTDYIPVLQRGDDKPVITQWDMNWIDKLGMLKIDFLGSRNVSIIDLVVENVEKSKSVHITEPYITIPKDDKETYQSLGLGENVGVFQLESPGMLSLMISMKPSSIEEIAALLALYRPGPMASNLHNEYVERKHGRRKVSYLHPSLEPYLKDTYGLLIYQEQVLSIARFVAGFSVPDSDGLRKAIGKKIPEEMRKWRSKFINGCVETSTMPYLVAEQLFNEIEHHADYSFSKNHAVSYAFTSYLTAYFKTKYPVEFFAAAMSSLGGSKNTDKDRLKLYLNQCKKSGIQVLPPSIIDKNVRFNVDEENRIIYGFESMKGFGEKTIELLAKDENEYSSLFDFFRKANTAYLDRQTISSLIDAGCLDEFLFGLDIPEGSLSPKEKNDTLLRELDTLGVFLTDHPFAGVEGLVKEKTTHSIKELHEMASQEKVTVAGTVVQVDKKITRQGKKMFILTIEDIVSAISVTVMPNIAAKLPDDPFDVGDTLIITGKTKREGDDENAVTGLILFDMEKLDDSLLSGGKPIFLSTNKTLSYEQLNRINDIIEKNQGDSPVFLSFMDGQRKIQIKFSSPTSEKIETELELLVKAAI